jgi:hypothetical protein
MEATYRPPWLTGSDSPQVLRGGRLRVTVRAVLGRLSAIIVFLFRSVLHGAFVWARRALNSQKRRFPARAVRSIATSEYSSTTVCQVSDHIQWLFFEGDNRIYA